MGNSLSEQQQKACPCIMNPMHGFFFFEPGGSTDNWLELSRIMNKLSWLKGSISVATQLTVDPLVNANDKNSISE